MGYVLKRIKYCVISSFISGPLGQSDGDMCGQRHREQEGVERVRVPVHHRALGREGAERGVLSALQRRRFPHR